MSRTVIVGAGQAGAVAAVKLREFGYNGEIVLIGAEQHPPYERPELSKAYALGQMPFEKLVLLPADKATEQRIEMRLAAPVVAIDRDKQVVRTAEDEIGYDHLILATGGEGRRIPLPDQLADKVHIVRSREDADALGKALAKAATAAIIGGGWLGLEAAATCKSSGINVHLYETAPRLCARVAPEWLSSVLHDIQADNGVALHLGETPEITDDGQIVSASGSITPDVIVLAVGMTANDSLAADAGLRCNDGVLVSENGQSSDPKIFAIGDCARYVHLGNLRRESWQNANQSAEDAARGITGSPRRNAEPDWFWSKQFKHNIQMLGTCTDAQDAVLRVHPKTGAKSCFFLDQGLLVGCIAVDSARDIGMSRGLVAKGQKVDHAKLSDPAIPIRGCVET